MRSLAASLREAEVHEHGTPEERAAVLAFVNQLWAGTGTPALEDEEEPPELELYRRARALGMARTSR